MTTVKDIIALIETSAPRDLAEEWDNPGLAVGDENMAVTGILTSLDCDLGVVEEALEKGCNMIVCHHPLIFRPLSFVTTENEVGKVVLLAAAKGVAIYSAHTNLDCAKGGTNDFLCKLFELENVQICKSVGEGNLVRVGEVEPTKLSELAKQVAQSLEKKYIRCVGDPEKIIQRVGICSGGGGEYITDMAELCDLYITGDVKYHMARSAAEAGLCVAIAEHFETEHFAKEILKNILSDCEVPVFCSEKNKDVVYDIIL